MKEIQITLLFIAIFSFSCRRQREPKSINNSQSTPQIDTTTIDKKQIIKPEKTNLINYEMKKTKPWLLEHEQDSIQQAIVFAINRTDKVNFLRMDSALIPSDFSFDISNYLPFPLKVNYLKNINKIIYFSYPTQTFAAYDKGILTYTGPNSRRVKKLQLSYHKNRSSPFG
jgi:hypothetical protein